MKDPSAQNDSLNLEMFIKEKYNFCYFTMVSNLFPVLKTLVSIVIEIENNSTNFYSI